MKTVELKVCVSESPGTAEYRIKLMEDMALCLNCKIVSVNDLITIKLNPLICKH